MLDLLDIGLNQGSVVDGDEFAFPDALRVHMLNRAQDYVIPKLQRHFRRPLDQNTDDIALGTSGEYDLTSLSPNAFQTTIGIDGIKHQDGYFCTLTSFDQIRALNLKGIITIRNTEPLYYVRGTTIYVLPYTSGDEVDIYYYSAPAAMVYDGVALNSVDCEFNDEVCDIIIDRAVSRGLKVLSTRHRDSTLLNMANRLAADADVSITDLNMSAPMSETAMFGQDRGKENLFGDTTTFNVYKDY